MALGGRKVGSLKRRVRSHLAKMRDEKLYAGCGPKHISKSKVSKTDNLGPLLKVQMWKKCALLWREAHFQVKMYKTPHVRTIFSSWAAHRCGAKHMSKWKCTKYTSSRPLLDVEMPKTCAPLWHEAHFQVKSVKTDGFGPLFDVQISKKCTPLWREAHLGVKSVKNWWFWVFFDVQISRKCTVTNLTNLTTLTNLTHLTNSN